MEEIKNEKDKPILIPSKGIFILALLLGLLFSGVGLVVVAIYYLLKYLKFKRTYGAGEFYIV